MNRIAKYARDVSAVGAACFLTLLPSCSDPDSDPGKGKISFSTWGEEYIEQEIPPSKDGETIVADGWTIHYKKFLIVIRNIRVANAENIVYAEMKNSKLFDMTSQGVKPIIDFPNVLAKPYERVSYEVSAASADTELIGPATNADKDLMVSNGYSVYVDAEATKGQEKKSYTWGFKEKTIYDRCRGEVDGKEIDGALVKPGSTDTIELTIHGDHLYYDDLAAAEAKVRFDNIAGADTNNDGIVTLEELSVVKLAAIPKENGSYGTGGRADVNDLSAFVTALSRTLGHFRGEGECFAPDK